MATESPNSSELSLQEQLFTAIQNKYPDAEAKKINKDNFLDIYIPSISAGRGTHLFFNTVKGAIKIGYYTRDESFINKVVSNASKSIEGASNGLRITGNPKFDDLKDALSAAFDFLSNMTNDSPVSTVIEDKKSSEIESIEDVATKFRDSYLDEEELAESISSYLDDFSEKGKIVVLQIEEEDLIKSTNNHDLLSGDLFTLIGIVGINSWQQLSKLIGKEESDWVNNEFEDEDPGGIVLLYCDGKYVYSFSNPKEEDETEDTAEDDEEDLDDILRELGYGDDDDEKTEDDDDDDDVEDDEVEDNDDDEVTEDDDYEDEVTEDEDDEETEDEDEEEEAESITNKYPVSDYSDLEKLKKIIKEDVDQIRFADSSLLKIESNLKALILVNVDIFPLLPESCTASKSIRHFAVENGYYDSEFLGDINLDDTTILYKIINNNSNYYTDLPDQYKDRELTKIAIKNQSADISFDHLPSNLQTDSTFFKELLTYLNKNLTYEPISGYSYCDTLLDGFKKSFTDDADFIIKNRLFEYASKRLIQDKEFNLNYLKANPEWYDRLIENNDSLKNDEAFARLAVQLSGVNFLELAEEFSNSREILNLAVENSKGSLMINQISEDLLYDNDGDVDVDLLLKLIKSNHFNISKVPDAIMLNSAVASQLILAASSKNNVLYYAPEFLRTDKEFITKLTSENIFTIAFADKSILADREFMQGIVAKMPVLIKFCSAELKADKLFVKEAVNLNGLVIRYIDEKLLNDPEIYWAALRQNPESYKILPSEIYTDKAIVDYISKINGGILTHFSTSVHSKPIKFNCILNSADGSYPEELTVSKTLGDKPSKNEILEVIKIDPTQIVFLSEEFFVNNKDLLGSILEITSYPLKFKSCRKALGEQELKKQLKTHSWALKYIEADESLSNEFLKELLSINGNLLQLLTQEQRKDNSFVEIALKRNPEACHFVAEEFDWKTQEAKAIAKQILSVDPLLFTYFIEKDPTPIDEFFDHAYFLDSYVLELMDHSYFEEAWYFISDSNGSYPLIEDQLISGLNQNHKVYYYDPINNTVKNVCLAIESGLNYAWDELFTNWEYNLQIIEKAFEYFPDLETYEALKKKLGKKFNENDYVNAKVVARGSELYPLISEGLKKNQEIAYAYLKSDDYSDLSSKFDCLPSSFKKDGSFLQSLVGLKIEFEILDGFFDPSILYTETFLIPYLELNFEEYPNLPEKLQNNRNLALQYGINNNETSYWGLTELALPEKLGQDRDLILDIAKGNKSRNIKFDDALLNDSDFLLKLIEFQPQLVKSLEEDNRNLTSLMKLLQKNIDVFDYLELEEKFIPEIFNFMVAHDRTKIRNIEWSYTLSDSLVEITEKLNILNYVNLFEDTDFGDTLSTNYSIESLLLNKQVDSSKNKVGTQFYFDEPGTITLGYDRNCYLSEDVAGEISDEIMLEFLESDDSWSDYIYGNSWYDCSDIFHTYGMGEPATDMQLPNGKILPISLNYERPQIDNLLECFNMSSKGSFVHIAVSDEKAYGWGQWKSYTLEVKPGIFDIDNISVEFESGIVSSYSYNYPNGDDDQFEENEDYTTTGQGFTSTLYFNNGKELIDADDIKDLLEENEIDTTDLEAIKEFLLQHYD